jgi:hypothetical protein
MRPSNKSRNRNKSNNRRGAAGNNINRVFDSSGPEGRVRGTPQQIIDKYISLTYDAQLSGDRVAAENFQQHAEHYSRLLIEAQKELAEKQIEQSAVLANTKSTPKPVEENSNTMSSSSNGIDQVDHKIVNFEKNLEINPVVTKLTDEKSQLKKDTAVRKVTKKRGSLRAKPVEV